MPTYLNSVAALRVRILLELIEEHGGMVTEFSITRRLKEWGFKHRLDQGWTEALFEMAEMNLIFAHRKQSDVGEDHDIIHLLPGGWLWLRYQSGCWDKFRSQVVTDIIALARAILREEETGPGGKGRQIEGAGIAGVTTRIHGNLQQLREHPNPTFRRPLIINAGQVRGLLALAQQSGLIRIGMRGSQTLVWLPPRPSGQVMLDRPTVETALRHMQPRQKRAVNSAGRAPKSSNVVSILSYRPRHAPEKLPVGRLWSLAPLGAKVRAVCMSKAKPN